MKKVKKKKKKPIKRLIAAAVLLLLLCNLGTLGRLLYPARYLDYIKEYTAAYAVDPYLVMSMIKTESNFNHEAVSHKEATGLMQITPQTAGWLAEKMGLDAFSAEQMTDPALNIQMGCYYVSYLLALYDGDVNNMLAAYNAGTGTVNGWLNDRSCSKDGQTLYYIPYPETRHYITQVTNHQKMYRLLYKIHT